MTSATKRGSTENIAAVPKQDQATATRNKRKNLTKIGHVTRAEIYRRADRQTDRQTDPDTRITILRSPMEAD